MAEYPIILAHNVLDEAALTGNSIPGHELERMRDGHRHTWWEAPSTEQQTITITRPNLIENGDFEASGDVWSTITAGDGAGTLSVNTTSPINGAKDLKAVVTTADAADDAFILTTLKPLYFKAGRTYRLMCKARATTDDVAIRFGFLDDDFTESSSLYASKVVGSSIGAVYHDLAPASDGWYHPYIRICEPATVEFDDFYLNEARAVDTLVIDAGHSMRLAYIKVKCSEDGVDWVTASEGMHYHDGPVYREFTGRKALLWQIVITVAYSIGTAPPAKIPLLHLGKRWTLPRHFSGSFDPDECARFDDDAIGERGILQRVRKYDQRLIRGSLSHLTAADYANVAMFFEDSSNGAKPFFMALKPATNPNDMLCMRLKTSRNVPYINGALRTWSFEAEEVVGRRIV